MISRKMLSIVVSYRSVQYRYTFRDGRTVRALQNRGLIKHVSQSKRNGLWTFKFTQHGKRLALELRRVSPATLEDLT